jgi:hypothetical protein
MNEVLCPSSSDGQCPLQISTLGKVGIQGELLAFVHILTANLDSQSVIGDDNSGSNLWNDCMFMNLRFFATQAGNLLFGHIRPIGLTK